jgi:hypothetical protein
MSAQAPTNHGAALPPPADFECFRHGRSEAGNNAVRAPISRQLMIVGTHKAARKLAALRSYRLDPRHADCFIAREAWGDGYER